MKKGKVNAKKGLLWTLILLIVVLAVVIYLLATQETAQVTSGTLRLSGAKVVLDAGHGGRDAGTSGVTTQVKESDINLQITLRLQAALEAEGAQVVMTRETEAAIGDSKDADMEKRRQIISESNQDVTVSIHQNSYEDSSVSGPQVFYAPGSAEGGKLAKCVQDALNEQLKIEDPLTQHEGNYYIVKSGAAPAVIVECGFLSNPEEEVLLQKEAYQIQIVQAIVDGIVSYLDTSEGGGSQVGTTTAD